MCRVCEGRSIEDVVALDAAHIAGYGYGIQGFVGPGENDGFGSWAYTVGLLDLCTPTSAPGCRRRRRSFAPVPSGSCSTSSTTSIRSGHPRRHAGLDRVRPMGQILPQKRYVVRRGLRAITSCWSLFVR